MTPFEWLALFYFAALPLAAARHGRRRGWLFAVGAAVLVIVARFLPPGLRAWTPHAYLVLGYWIPAAFTPGINSRFETWLARADARLGLPAGAGGWRSRHVLELAYLLCYPLVPAAFAVVFVAGDDRDITRFWLAVLSAGFACYGTLPWTAARPPRLLATPEATVLARFNVYVLGCVSHRMNTFPSGHVAVALAAAFSVGSVSWPWGMAFLIATGGIAVAAVTGRYHYLVDVLAGAGVGVLGVLLLPPL